jgi:4-hydroxy-tetrahydrodipicolinate synthase
MEKLIQGVYAAVLTPRRPDDTVDEAPLVRLIEFLLERGVSGFALNGATGEFCLTTSEHLRTLFSIVHKTARDAAIICGIGAAGLARTLELAEIAAGEGSQAVLLSMPYFFPYQQDDLEEFVQTVAARIKLPVMLYNLPEFTSALAPETSCHLIRTTPNVIGIKDSGQSLATLRQLTVRQIPACRIVGNDGLLAGALREGVCDGVVSGVACVLPELIRDLFHEELGSEHFEQLCVLLDTFRQQIARFPVPWGLKWIAEARGILNAAFSQPLASGRRQQSEAMIEWYRHWQPNFLPLAVPCQR